MIQLLKEYISKEKLIETNECLLLAVSGGIDSVVMAHLLKGIGTKGVIAHCNFSLRNSESDHDQEFVSRLAQKLGYTFEYIRFDTEKYASENQLSIQMAARELRYNWFNKILVKHNLNKIALAHNKNDLVETFHINLLRGSGIHGLCGFLPKHNNIIRPLLFASREEIVRYATGNKIEYREDSSNSNLKYLRNSIRHKVIPQLEELSSSYLENVAGTMKILQSVKKILDDQVKLLRSELIIKKKNYVSINIDELTSKDLSIEILYEVLAEFGFNFTSVLQIGNSVRDANSGSRFLSETHELLVDRDEVQIRPIKCNDDEVYYIREQVLQIDKPIKIDIKRNSDLSGFIIPKDQSHGAFDADLLEFPLCLRRWQKGDSFVPLGMKGHKKLSDFFVDNKFSLFDKEKTWLLTSAGKIAWVVGHRISDEFKVTSTTKRVVVLSLKE